MSDKASNKKQLIIIFFTVFIDLVGFGIIIPLSPYLAREFGADAVDVGLLMSIYSLMQFVFNPWWGRVSDRFGRRPVLLLSLAGSAIANLAFAFSTQLWMLFAARAFAGLFGANVSTSMAYIADVTEAKDRSKNMGLIGAAFGLGFILGPFLGGIFGMLGAHLGTHPPFGDQFAAVAAAGICFANFLFAVKYLPESLSAELRGQIRQQKSRILRMARALKKPVIGPLIFIIFLTTLAMAHIENCLFLYVQDELAWNLAKASFGFAYVGIVMVFTQGYLIRKLMPKYGERHLLPIGIVLASIGFAGIGLTVNIWALAVIVTCLGIGVGFINPSVTGSISLLTAKTEQGETLGVNQSMSALARVIGPVIGGWFYKEWGHPSPFLMAGAFEIAALMIVVVLFTRIPLSGRAS